jgi:DNA-directed RNA polymerase subunit RPC12/RpoP
MRMELETVKVSGRGCTHCAKRMDALLEEESRPSEYRCPVCRARWIFVEHVYATPEELQAGLQAMSPAEREELLRGLIGFDVVLESS